MACSAACRSRRRPRRCRRNATRLAADLAAIQNKTRRLSDGFLDIDLLDEQARDVLGMIRSDEIVIR